ncbi:hypothetical protein JX265_010959 [Neoarthrinium moseri]|uniref:Uncharacterized protein n=1 Tax=Neoarthrinium moseri TaxID=1658444 RepID=A0A9Q0AJV0_9PEZI|nr:hypothetical protein JX266_003187 [Neoarthrinium moseri]KAI1857929.1 hypothetical protein JX265_010959 [Neoarthrinium moseri]
MPGSPHPHARRGRQGSPHPVAIQTQQQSTESTSASSQAASPSLGPPGSVDDIPELISIAPAIFVPATFDLTKPQAPLPADSSGRTTQQLAELDAHTAAVKSNIAWMIEREAKKIHQDAVKQELSIKAAGLPPPRSKRLPPTKADEDELIRNLEAPIVPGAAYGVPLGVLADQIPPLLPDPRDTPREAFTTRMLGLVRYGMQQMDGYEAHANGVKQQKREEIARQIAGELARGQSQAGTASGFQAPGNGEKDQGTPMDVD